MNNILCIVLLTTVCTLGSAQTVHLAADKKPSVEQEIMNLELELEKLFMAGNVEKYAAYLADDYTLINPAGLVVSRENILSALKSSGASRGDSLLPDNLSVRVYGETAVLNGHLTWKGTDNGVNIRRESLFTKVFVRKKKHWYMVNSQGTVLPQR